MNQWLSSGVAQPMAGKPAKAHQNGWGIWLYNMGIRQGSTDFFSFSEEATRSLLYETQSLRRWTSHRSGSRPHSDRPTHHFSAAGPRIPCRHPATLSLENSSIRANLFAVVANAAPFLSFVQEKTWSCSRGIRWMLHSHTEIPGNATLPA